MRSAWTLRASDHRTAQPVRTNGPARTLRRKSTLSVAWPLHPPRADGFPLPLQFQGLIKTLCSSSDRRRTRWPRTPCRMTNVTLFRIPEQFVKGGTLPSTCESPCQGMSSAGRVCVCSPSYTPPLTRYTPCFTTAVRLLTGGSDPLPGVAAKEAREAWRKKERCPKMRHPMAVFDEGDDPHRDRIIL